MRRTDRVSRRPSRFFPGRWPRVRKRQKERACDRPAVFQVNSHRVNHERRQGNQLALFATLASNPGVAAIQVGVVQVEPTQLRHAEPAAHEGKDDRVGAGAVLWRPDS
jgi:hypothetical protein